MPDIEDMDLDAEVSLRDEAGVPVGVEKPATGGSSPSNDVSNTVADDVDFSAIVRDAVEKKPAATSAEASSATEESGAALDGTQTKTPDDENFSDVPFNKHPRFKEILEQRNSFKTDAERYRNVEKFLSDNHLESDEAADGLQIMALAKIDPGAALERVKPWVEKLMLAAGEILPNDLQQLVSEKRLDPQAALEISRARAGTQNVQVQRQLDQRRVQQRDADDTATRVNEAVSSWEADRQGKDPNFASKMPALLREVAYLQTQEGRPADPAAVRAQLDRAYAAVNSALPAQTANPATVQRPKAAITPVRGGQPGGNARPAAPTSTAEMIRSVVARRGAN